MGSSARSKSAPRASDIFVHGAATCVILHRYPEVVAIDPIYAKSCLERLEGRRFDSMLSAEPWKLGYIEGHHLHEILSYFAVLYLT